ncbi:MAG TPA: hypothetical protein VIL06_01245 [Coriobacteriia bacterium]
MKRLIALIVTSVFGLGLGVALLSSPAVAVGHPGNTCNPAPGHGRSGCHRVTTSSGSGTKTTSKTASQKRAAATPVVAAKKKAATRLAAAATAATAPSVMGTAPASLVPLHPAAPRLPWWLQIWHFLFG